MSLTRAVVSPPSSSFALGLTRGEHGRPSIARAEEQHERYCEALSRCGLRLTRLPADADHPDGTFVEDAAIVTGRGAILTRPGAASRRGEVAAVREALAGMVPLLGEIVEPGTVDGGDVCEASGRFLIGLSARTNEEGAGQLRALLGRHGYEAATIDVRGVPELLHLKTGLASLDDGRLIAVSALADRDELRGFPLVRVADAESYAANAVCVNGRVLIARGFPVLEASLTRLGYDVLTLEMSEFRKMEGGLSCLSIRL